MDDRFLTMGIVLDLETNRSEIEQIRLKGLKIGLCHGDFNLMHPGHIEQFEYAKSIVDILIVSVTHDEIVNQSISGPLFALNDRLRFLKNFSLIDYIVVSQTKTSVDIIKVIRPDFFFKGPESLNFTTEHITNSSKEEREINLLGGKVVYTQGFQVDSSNLGKMVFPQFTSESIGWLNSIKQKFNINDIYSKLDEISKLKVVLIGEIIIDRYTEVEALAKTGKDPILAFHIKKSETFPGGILAIREIISNWVHSVDVISSEIRPEFKDFLETPPKNTNFHLIPTSSPTITKHRFIDRGSNCKLFETYDFDPNYIEENDHSNFFPLATILTADLVMVADYGHGLIQDKIVRVISEHANYLCVNVQSNAGNRGFNTLEKYPKADFFTANSGELQLQSRSLNPNYHKLMSDLISSKKSKAAIMTEGERGLTVFKQDINHKAPALAIKVVDKVGAGDSVFAISSLLSKVDTPIEIIGLLSNLVAANEVLRRGHSKSISLDELKEQIKSLFS
jgi:cytidyltransferase-like protein